jgi:hypothetical protein
MIMATQLLPHPCIRRPPQPPSGILLIIIVAVYTAGTAARLTAAQLTGGIRGRDDLKGRAVGTW